MNYKTIKNHFLLTVFLMSLFTLKGQFVKQSISVALPAESEHYNRLIPDGSDFLFLKKAKSNEITTKIFDLVRHSSDLKEKWSVPVALSQFENVLNVSLLNQKLNIITVEHNLDSTTSKLFIRQHNSVSGKEMTKRMLFHNEIGTWINSFGKAKVAQTFNSAVASKQNANDVTPLEYRFEVGYSLDSSRIIIYQYDNSKDKLMIKGGLFNSNFDLIKRINLSVDDAHKTYGLKVDNNGEIYLLKVSNKGKLAVLNLNLITGKESSLTLPEGSTDKVNPRLHIHASHEVYIVYCNVKYDHLQSVSLATLNFETETVDDSHLYNLDPEYLILLNTHIRNGDKYYELAEIEEVNDQLVVLLEQHQIEGLDIHYHPNDDEKLAHWESGNATITTGNMLVLVFDKSLEPKGQFVVKKNQTGSIKDGMNTLSHRVFRSKDGLRFVYSNSNKRKINNELHSSFLNLNTFKLSDVVVSIHGKKLVPVLTSTAFSSDGSIVFQSRQGKFGRKNYLSRWNFNTH